MRGIRLDEFFQRLREIQKKERSTSGLANVGDNFYKDVHNYLNKLIMKIGNNPFSFESYLLRDARRIAAEICERREYKITNSALMNIHRSYRIFDEKSEKSDISSPTLPPSNLTPEEEDLYYSLVKSFSKYRHGMKSPLTQFKAKKAKQELKSEAPDIQGPSVQLSNEKLSTDKVKKAVPIGIEQDIESFQAYGSPGFEAPDIEPPIEPPIEPELELEIEPEIDFESLEKGISKASDQKDPVKTLMVLEELPSIMCIDKKVYGPLSPQDIITMPEPNARIIIKNNKGKFIEKYEKISYR
jgi:DNA replication factor GINS